MEKRRGYLAFRKSTHEHWFVKVHILWHPPEPNDCFVSYAPLKDDLGPFPPPLFKGRVVQGDDEYTGHLRKARGEQQACPVFQQKQKGQQP
ncbi:MAG: hypothetical protein RBR43_10110 [Desulfuromonadaceae bacterium]|nr:hypothetical protein [Desulfuromonadaceae bacterium]